MGCIVWGEEYIRNFLRYNVRSMLSEDNLPALARAGQGRLQHRHRRGRRAAAALPIRCSPSCREIADVEFTIVPDSLIEILRHGHLVQNFYVLYGMLDHCSIYFAEGAGSHLFMIPVDCVVASGTLVNMANYRHQGYECCGGGNLVAETETFLPAIDERFGSEGPIRISTYELASLAFQHAHHYFQSQVIAAENRDFGRHPRELFWPVEGGVEIHSVFIHPLFTTAAGLAKYRRKHFANIDYGMIPRLFTHPGPIKLMDPEPGLCEQFHGSASPLRDDRQVLRLRGLPALPRLDLPGAEGLLHPGAASAVPPGRLHGLQRRRAGRSGDQRSVRRQSRAGQARRG